MADSRLERIKLLTIIALVSDDALMDRIVLKGGNALRLVHGMHARQSLDLDFSIDGDLGPIEETRNTMARLLSEAFRGDGLVVFDVKLSEAPPNLTQDAIGGFWGGYTLEFKVLPVADFERLSSDPQRRRAQSLELGPGQRRAFTVDFSKHEHCAGKVAHTLDGYRVYVYSGLMIACEKIRAICQQMPEYRLKVMSTTQRPRARDFFDIHRLVDAGHADLSSERAWLTLSAMFAAKRVPLRLLGEISARREFHRENFSAVRDTVDRSIKLEPFDFYVDFLVDRLRPLQPRWEVDPPAG